MWLAFAAAAAATLSAPPSLVFEPGLGGAVCWRIPSLVPLSPTALLALAGSRCTNGDGCQPAGYNGTVSARAMVGLRRSFDGGRTWQPLQVVYSAPCAPPAVTGTDATAVFDPTSGTVFTLMPALPDRKTLLVYSSTDSGATWAQRAAPIPLPALLAASSGDVTPGNGLVLSSGRIVFLGQGHGSKYFGAFTVVSDDGGSSWLLQSIDGGGPTPTTPHHHTHHRHHLRPEPALTCHPTTPLCPLLCRIADDRESCRAHLGAAESGHGTAGGGAPNRRGAGEGAHGPVRPAARAGRPGRGQPLSDLRQLALSPGKTDKIVFTFSVRARPIVSLTQRFPSAGAALQPVDMLGRAW